MKLTTSNATVTNTVVSSRLTIGNNAVVESLTVGNVSINSSAIAVGNVSITPAAISTPSLILGGTAFVSGLFGGIVSYQEFTANGTWYNHLVNAAANASLTGNEQVFVMAWGGGGGGSSNNTVSYGGGGGACVLGYYTLSNISNTISVTVGLGGTASRTTTTAMGTGGTGGNSIFGSITAYGGAGGSPNGGGGGGGTLGVGSTNGTGGAPLGGALGGGISTYGGGGGVSALSSGARSIFGGGGGVGSAAATGGSSFYGGGGGGTSSKGISIFGGAGGPNANQQGETPAGAGGANTSAAGAGARGEVRVWVIGPGSTTIGAPTYTLTANTTTVVEGSSVLYTVSTTNVANNTTLYYTLNNSSTAVATDFTTAVNGSVVITGGTGTFILTANLDNQVADETLIMDIRTGNGSGPIVASNSSVNVVPYPELYFVGSSTTSNTTTITLPTGLIQNDLVIITVTAQTNSSISGYTRIIPTSASNYGVFYKFMGATPDTSATIVGTSAASVAFALRNANTSSPLDGTAASTGVSPGDPPSITTSFANSIVFTSFHGLGGSSYTAPPSGYTLVNARFFDAAEQTLAAVAYQQTTTSGSYNPGTWNASGDGRLGTTFAIKKK